MISTYRDLNSSGASPIGDRPGAKRRFSQKVQMFADSPLLEIESFGGCRNQLETEDFCKAQEIADLSEEENPPGKIHPKYRIHLNKFVSAISVGSLARVTGNVRKVRANFTKKLVST